MAPQAPQCPLRRGRRGCASTAPARSQAALCVLCAQFPYALASSETEATKQRSNAVVFDAKSFLHGIPLQTIRRVHYHRLVILLRPSDVEPWNTSVGMSVLSSASSHATFVSPGMLRSLPRVCVRSSAGPVARRGRSAAAGEGRRRAAYAHRGAPAVTVQRRGQGGGPGGRGRQGCAGVLQCASWLHYSSSTSTTSTTSTSARLHHNRERRDSESPV